MTTSTFSMSEVRSLSLPEALARVEAAWGVCLSVSVVREYVAPEGHRLNIMLDVYKPEHRAELHNPPAAVVPMFDTRLVPLEVQLVAAVAGYCLMLDEHMRT